MDSLCGEPVCLWLPEKLRDGKSEYVQGVEAAPDYKGIIPEGFDVIDLPECNYLMFQGEPFAEKKILKRLLLLSGNLKRNIILLLLVTKGIKKIHEFSLNHEANAAI